MLLANFANVAATRAEWQRDCRRQRRRSSRFDGPDGISPWRLQRAEAAFDPLPFDAEAARAYGRVYSAVVAAGRKARGARAVDLLLAAAACAAGLPLYTRNPDDFRAIGDLVEVVAV